MDRDFGTEIDSLKEELQQIRKMMLRSHLPKTEPKTPKEGKDVLTPEGREQLNDLRNQLIAYAEDHHETGAIAYTGTFSSGSGESTMQSIWVAAVQTDYLLALNDNRMVEKVLTSVGNSQRLAIVLALLKKPMTVNELIEVIGFNSTGQAYHHLKPLVSADIIKEEKGVYAVIPHRVQGIIMLLAGVWDLIDTRYTSGNWEEQS
jgi:DNA gyrase subunit B